MPIINFDIKSLGRSRTLTHETFKMWPNEQGKFKTKYMEDLKRKLEKNTDFLDSITQLLAGVKLALDDALAANNVPALKAVSDNLGDKALLDAAYKNTDLEIKPTTNTEYKGPVVVENKDEPWKLTGESPEQYASRVNGQNTVNSMLPSNEQESDFEGLEEEDEEEVEDEPIEPGAQTMAPASVNPTVPVNQ